MKTLNKYITETIKDTDKSIIEFLKFLADNSSGYQKELFTKKLNDANSVDVVPLSEVFTEQEIKEIKVRVRPQPKACYENAWKLCDRLSYENKHDIQYCEGYLNYKGIPLEHAFNKVDGKYVDITVELALNREIEDTYVVIGEFDVDSVMKILLQNGFYGNIYDTIELNKYKEKIDKKDKDAA